MSRYKKGDTFPLFTFDTAFQTGLSSHEVLKGKTVFWVLRYIGCTVCRYDVHKIAERYPEFTAQNAQVFVIMQSDRRHVQDNLSATDTVLPFEIITDPEQKIYDLLSVPAAASKEELAADAVRLTEKRNQAIAHGFSHGDYEGNELQLPAMFVVGENAEILYARYASDITDLPDVDELLKILAGLG